MMVDFPKGVLAFQANGETYKLVFDFNALCQLEDEMGVSVSDLGEKMNSARGVRTVFRIGLARHHPNLSESETGDIITVIGPQRAGQLVGEAFQAANPPQEAGKGKSRPRAGAALTS